MILAILAFLFVLAFSVTIHEFGHFLIAKLFRIPVEKFSIGFGPPFIRKQIGETDFRIAYFPLGGYVKMAGEDEGEVFKKKDTAPTDEVAKGIAGFYDAPILNRILVVCAGPLFNIISAAVIFFLVFSVYGTYINPYTKIIVDAKSSAERLGLATNDSVIAINEHPVKDWDDFVSRLPANKEIVLTVMRNDKRTTISAMSDSILAGIEQFVPPILGSLKIDGPAYQAGMKSGDTILTVGGNKVTRWNEMVERVRVSRSIALEFTWRHKGEIRTATITPITIYDPIEHDSIGQIGVMMPLVRNRIPLFSAAPQAINRTGEVLWLTLKTIYQIIIGEISRKSLGGPIAIAKLSGESARWGFDYLLGLLAIISINLGLINLFPIPALDGGHVVVALIEAIRQRRFSLKTRLVIQQIGYAILLFIILFVTFNDITR